MSLDGKIINKKKWAEELKYKVRLKVIYIGYLFILQLIFTYGLINQNVL